MSRIFLNISGICDKFHLNSVVVNKNQVMDIKSEVFIINFYGGLNHFFKYAKSIFLGKSTLKKFEKSGGQNPIDAARFGCKIYHGPFVYNFEEIYELFKKNEISKKIEDFYELSSFLISDLKEKRKETKNFKFLDDLGKKTLDETMINIKKFLMYEIQ